MEKEIRINEVCGFIRKHVERPKFLPLGRLTSGRGLSWSGKCPLGLLQIATHPRPGGTASLGGEDSPFTQDEIFSFYTWWDTQTSPQKAVNRVWGKE